MTWLWRLLGARFSLLALISAGLAGSAAWKLQALRYTGQISYLKANLQSCRLAAQTQVTAAHAHLKAKLAADRAQRATAQAQLVQAQAKVAHRVEVQYRDRIRIIKQKGETIVQRVPMYVTPQDSARFGVPVGFVRSYNAAFSGIAAGTPAESDREPARLSLAEIAETTAFNANVCRQWREQALGWRGFYRGLQKTAGTRSIHQSKTVSTRR